MSPGNPDRHLYAEFSTSCITGEIVPSKVTQEASLCDNDSQDGINRQRRVRLLNLGDASDPNQQFCLSASNW